MRFKQTKPQHVRKKEQFLSNANSKDEIELTTDVNVDQENGEWDGGDSIDGHFDCQASEKKPAKQDNEGQAPSNGHVVGMDLEPMLALYREEKEMSTAKSSIEAETLERSFTPSTSEGEVIIQGRRPIFSESEESNIASQLKQWKEQGTKYTRLDVVKMASEYAVQLGKRPQGRPLTVKWFRSFLTRHPECYIRKSRKLKTESQEKPEVNHLESIFSTGNVKNSPYCIFSLLELTLPVPKNGELLGSCDSAPNSNGVGLNGAKSNQESGLRGKIPSSILFCGSAAGQALPPFLIFSGKTLDKSWMTGVTPGCGGVACPSGQLTSEVLYSFLKEHFLCQAPGRVDDGLVVLVDADIGRLLNQAILDLASAFKIVFVTAVTSLNPHLHPLANGCCNVFQREFCFELQKPLYSTELSSVPSSSICEFLCRLYHRSMCAENLHSTFKKSGIYPFNVTICRKRYASALICTSGNPSQRVGNHGYNKVKKECKVKAIDLVIKKEAAQEDMDSSFK